MTAAIAAAADVTAIMVPGSLQLEGAFSVQLTTPEVAELVQAVMEDPAMPAHVKSPMFRWALEAWARCEVVKTRLFAWCEELGPEALSPRMPGTRAPAETWRSAATASARARARLGFDPVSYAGLMSSLGLNARAAEESLGQLAEAGAAIVARRRELESGGS